MIVNVVFGSQEKMYQGIDQAQPDPYPLVEYYDHVSITRAYAELIGTEIAAAAFNVAPALTDTPHLYSHMVHLVYKLMKLQNAGKVTTLSPNLLKWSAYVCSPSVCFSASYCIFMCRWRVFFCLRWCDRLFFRTTITVSLRYNFFACLF